MKITFQGKDQNWQNEQTIYWFDVDGEQYGVSDCVGERALVDCDGWPVNLNDRNNLHLCVLFDSVTPEIMQE